MTTIDEFRGQFYFLSNFYEAPVMYQGLMYKNNESAFQSAKLIDVEERKQFCELPPNEAKALGRKVSLRSDWEEVKNRIMEEIVKDKFIRNVDLRQKLIDTGENRLIEGNTWNDTYWGICNGIGRNRLGIILMKVRQDMEILNNG